MILQRRNASVFNFVASDVAHQFGNKQIINIRGSDASSDYNFNDYGNIEPVQVSVCELPYNEPEYLDTLLAATTDEREVNIGTRIIFDRDVLSDFETQSIQALATHECEYMDLISNANETDISSLNDEIKRGICHPDTSIQPDENQPYPTEILESNKSRISPVHRNNLAKQPFGFEEDSRKQSYRDRSDQHLPGFSPHFSALNPLQITSSPEVRPALHFVHDVQPHQKTEHDMDEKDRFELFDQKSMPYIMRIQGIQTATDKGRNILPRLQVSI